jgi:flagellar protein FlgJ
MTDKEKTELMAACESFESYFLQMMLREMRKTQLDDEGFIPKGQAERIFTDLLDEERAKLAAKSGGIGLAAMMYKQMTAVNGG